MMVLIGRTRRHVLRIRYELRRIGYRWWQSEIVSMDMAKRKNHLHRQRKQRQLRARSKSRSEPFHYFKPPCPLLTDRFLFDEVYTFFCGRRYIHEAVKCI